MIRIGAIGVDTSHLPEFSRRLKEMHDAGTFGGRVTAMLDVGDHGWPDAEQVSQWISTAPTWASSAWGRWTTCWTTLTR
jgi:hypothetical protein